MSKSSKHSLLTSFILANGLELAVGETLNSLTCPFCHGGLHKDKSFSLTSVQHGYLYHCYRASCGISGLHLARGQVATRREGTSRRTAQAKVQTYAWPLISPSEAQSSWFASKFDLTPQELRSSGVQYNPARDSFAWPIRDYRGYDIGVLDRSYVGRKPKSIIYWFNQNVPKLYFPAMELTLGKSVLLVEDIISSIKAARHVNAVALLGTHVPLLTVDHLRNMYTRAIFALDKDATKVAITQARQFALYFSDGTTTILLEQDIKDMTSSAVRALLDNECRR